MKNVKYESDDSDDNQPPMQIEESKQEDNLPNVIRNESSDEMEDVIQSSDVELIDTSSKPR